MWDVVRIAPRACMRNNVEQRSGCSDASSRFSDFCMAEKRKPLGIGRTRLMTGGWLKGSSGSSPSSTSLPHIIIISRLFATWAKLQLSLVQATSLELLSLIPAQHLMAPTTVGHHKYPPPHQNPSPSIMHHPTRIVLENASLMGNCSKQAQIIPND